jgi:acyl dehydratase
MIDESIAGTVLPKSTITVDRSQIRLFAKAIGESDPVYSDLEVAQQCGHTDLPAPPTMLIGLMGAGDELTKLLIGAGGNLATMLHGEQSFSYDLVVHAGDHLTFQTRIDRVFSKKGGALQFVVQTSEIINADTDKRVATMEMTLIFRNGG